MVSRWRHSFHTKTLSGLIRWLRLRTRTSFGCLVHCVAHDIRAPPHTRIVLGRLVCNHLKTHASSCTCIVITGAPLHSGTAARSRVCAVSSRWRPSHEASQQFPPKPRKCSEARGPPKAPDQQTQLPKLWIRRGDLRHGVHRRPPANRLSPLDCGLSSSRETVRQTTGPRARSRERRRHAWTL